MPNCGKLSAWDAENKFSMSGGLKTVRYLRNILAGMVLSLVGYLHYQQHQQHTYEHQPESTGYY